MENRMLRSLALLAGAALSALAFAAPAPAQARATVVDQRFDGSYATAIFDSDMSACVQTSISVSVVDGRGASAATGTAMLTVVLNEFDACTGTELGSGVSQLALSPTQFAIDQKLASASLAAAVPFFDFASGHALTLVLSLAWTASDGFFESRLIFHSSGPDGTTELLRASGAFADAAVSGTPAYAEASAPAFVLRAAQLGESHDGTHIITK